MTDSFSPRTTNLVQGLHEFASFGPFDTEERPLNNATITLNLRP